MTHGLELTRAIYRRLSAGIVHDTYPNSQLAREGFCVDNPDPIVAGAWQTTSDNWDELFTRKHGLQEDCRRFLTASTDKKSKQIAVWVALAIFPPPARDWCDTLLMQAIHTRCYPLIDTVQQIRSSIFEKDLIKDPDVQKYVQNIVYILVQRQSEAQDDPIVMKPDRSLDASQRIEAEMYQEMSPCGEGLIGLTYRPVKQKGIKGTFVALCVAKAALESEEKHEMHKILHLCAMVAEVGGEPAKAGVEPIIPTGQVFGVLWWLVQNKKWQGVRTTTRLTKHYIEFDFKQANKSQDTQEVPITQLDATGNNFDDAQKYQVSDVAFTPLEDWSLQKHWEWLYSVDRASKLPLRKLCERYLWEWCDSEGSSQPEPMQIRFDSGEGTCTLALDGLRKEVKKAILENPWLSDTKKNASFNETVFSRVAHRLFTELYEIRAKTVPRAAYGADSVHVYMSLAQFRVKLAEIMQFDGGRKMSTREKAQLTTIKDWQTGLSSYLHTVKALVAQAVPNAVSTGWSKTNTIVHPSGSVPKGEALTSSTASREPNNVFKYESLRQVRQRMQPNVGSEQCPQTFGWARGVHTGNHYHHTRYHTPATVKNAQALKPTRKTKKKNTQNAQALDPTRACGAWYAWTNMSDKSYRFTYLRGSHKWRHSPHQMLPAQHPRSAANQGAKAHDLLWEHVFQQVDWVYWHALFDQRQKARRAVKDASNNADKLEKQEHGIWNSVTDLPKECCVDMLCMDLPTTSRYEQVQATHNNRLCEFVPPRQSGSGSRSANTEQGETEQQRTDREQDETREWWADYCARHGNEYVKRRRDASHWTKGAVLGLSVEVCALLQTMYELYDQKLDDAPLHKRSLRATWMMTHVAVVRYRHCMQSLRYTGSDPGDDVRKSVWSLAWACASQHWHSVQLRAETNTGADKHTVKFVNGSRTKTIARTVHATRKEFNLKSQQFDFLKQMPVKISYTLNALGSMQQTQQHLARLKRRAQDLDVIESYKKVEKEACLYAPVWVLKSMGADEQLVNDMKEYVGQRVLNGGSAYYTLKSKADKTNLEKQLWAATASVVESWRAPWSLAKAVEEMRGHERLLWEELSKITTTTERMAEHNKLKQERDAADMRYTEAKSDWKKHIATYMHHLSSQQAVVEKKVQNSWEKWVDQARDMEVVWDMGHVLQLVQQKSAPPLRNHLGWMNDRYSKLFDEKATVETTTVFQRFEMHWGKNSVNIVGCRHMDGDNAKVCFKQTMTNAWQIGELVWGRSGDIRLVGRLPLFGQQHSQLKVCAVDIYRSRLGTVFGTAQNDDGEYFVHCEPMQDAEQQWVYANARELAQLPKRQPTQSWCCVASNRGTHIICSGPRPNEAERCWWHFADDTAPGGEATGTSLQRVDGDGLPGACYVGQPLCIGVVSPLLPIVYSEEGRQGGEQTMKLRILCMLDQDPYYMWVTNEMTLLSFDVSLCTRLYMTHCEGTHTLGVAVEQHGGNVVVHAINGNVGIYTSTQVQEHVEKWQQTIQKEHDATNPRNNDVPPYFNTSSQKPYPHVAEQMMPRALWLLRKAERQNPSNERDNLFTSSDSAVSEAYVDTVDDLTCLMFYEPAIVDVKKGETVVYNEMLATTEWHLGPQKRLHTVFRVPDVKALNEEEPTPPTHPRTPTAKEEEPTSAPDIPRDMPSLDNPIKP